VALSYGKPVLASDLACFREIQQEAHAVELFESGDERTLAERIGYLLASASARKGLAEAAEAFARSRSWASVAEKTLAVYRTALAKRQ
jgi:glycosyltransferase involved in cell wall biosynthesis